MNRQTTRIYLGLFLLLLVMVNVGVWLYVAIPTEQLPFETTRQLYLSYFPGWLQNTFLLTILNIICCVAALSLTIQPSNSLSRLAQLVRIPTLVLSTVLLAWNAFTLM